VAHTWTKASVQSSSSTSSASSSSSTMVASPFVFHGAGSYGELVTPPPRAVVESFARRLEERARREEMRAARIDHRRALHEVLMYYSHLTSFFHFFLFVLC